MITKDAPLPDFRNVTRGTAWLRSIVEALERMDAGNHQAMDEVIFEMKAPLFAKREREPGEEG